MRKLGDERRDLLERMLTFGLELRAQAKQPLGRDHAVYEALSGLAVDSPSPRPCEGCSVPFSPQRANALRCPRCRSRREPLQRAHHLHAVVEDVYETVWVEGHWLETVEGVEWVERQEEVTSSAEPTGYVTLYYVECQHPGCEWCSESNRADTRRCLNHRQGAGRQRAATGGSSLGRKLFRYASANGQLLQTVSIVDIRLTAVEGVIETRDLEVVAALDAMDNLRRLDPSERIDRSLARRLRKQRETEERSRRVRAWDFYQRRAGWHPNRP